MFRFLRQLFGGKKSEEARPAESGEPPQSPEQPRLLRPTDASVIQARLQGLGFVESLNDAEATSLRRVVLERCRAGKDEAWWGPLRAWAATQRRSHGLLVASLAFEGPLHVHLAGVAELASDHGLRPVRSSPIEGGSALVCDLDDSEVLLRVRVTEGCLDAQDLARGLNALASGHRWPYRFLLLAEDQGLFGLIRAPAAAAERAARSSWGELPT